MNDAERKAVGYIVRLAVDMTAATLGSKPIYENRESLREAIGQRVDADIALLDVPGSLAEWVIAANRSRRAPAAGDGEREP